MPTCESRTKLSTSDLPTVALMLTSIASALLLGVVPTHANPPMQSPLPGIEVLSISAPPLSFTAFKVPQLSASGAILVDVISGQEIFSVNPDGRRPMASLTKIMTALLVLERHGLSEVVTIGQLADNIGGSTVGLKTGEQFSVANLLKALLLPSANDAAYALAMFDRRSVGAFVQSMNDRAAALGLKNTHFTNPAGLDNPMQFSSPRDLAWLTIAALKNSYFRQTVGAKSAEIASREGKTLGLQNTNAMLRARDEVYGVKTGTTDKAGECLIVLFHEHDRPYLLVLLGSKERYTDSQRVIEAVQKAA